MALSARASDETVNAEINAATALLNGGFLDLYDGTQPATADTPISGQILLASLVFGNPAFASGSGGIAIANAITSDPNAAATGIARFYRATKADHTSPVQDGSVGLSNCNVIMDDVRIQAGGHVFITSFTLIAPKNA